jgi:hypothetical protein
LESLWPFGTFYGYLVYFSRFGILRQDKSGNPARRRTLLHNTGVKVLQSLLAKYWIKDQIKVFSFFLSHFSGKNPT